MFSHKSTQKNPAEILQTGYISDKIWLQSEHEIGAHNKGGFTAT